MLTQTTYLPVMPRPTLLNQAANMFLLVGVQAVVLANQWTAIVMTYRHWESQMYQKMPQMTISAIYSQDLARSSEFTSDVIGKQVLGKDMHLSVSRIEPLQRERCERYTGWVTITSSLMSSGLVSDNYIAFNFYILKSSCRTKRSSSSWPMII